MKIKKVVYSALFNLGSYNNEKISFAAYVEEDENVDQVIEKLRDKAKECASPNIDNLRDSIRTANIELYELERKLHKARKEWDATAEFLRCQGIKPDALEMPKFNNLLPHIAEEESSVTEGELEYELEDESEDESEEDSNFL